MSEHLSASIRRALLCGVLLCTLTASAASIDVQIPVGAYEIIAGSRGHELTLTEFGSLLVPGKPQLPARIFALAIPPGAKVVAVTWSSGDPQVVPGTYALAPAPAPRALGDEDPALRARDLAEYDANYAATYGSDDLYPAAPVEFVRTAGYRRYGLVDVRVAPFAYRPRSQQLVYYPDLTVHVEYALPEAPPTPLRDHLARAEQTAREIVLNYEQAAQWYPAGGFTDAEGAYDFVLITLADLVEAVAPLVDWEQAKGRAVKVVTLDWIDANYTGYDSEERMRNFLRDKYPSSAWGITDVLFVGHYDDLPMRRAWQDVGYDKPETDFYYAELSKPDNQSWDANQNHRWGENSDPIDFYAEVNVGRIPWSDPELVERICRKSVAYEQNTDPAFKKNILLLGAFFWDEPDPRTDNAVLMEAKVDQPWMADWTMTRMYEKGWSTYAMNHDLKYNTVISVWSNGRYAFVNWAGHGSPEVCTRMHDPSGAFITHNSNRFLNDDYPAIIFADACSNSDTDYYNLGQAMIERGAVGFVGATKVAFGRPGWSRPEDGSSQSLDYFFTTRVTSGDFTQGAALQAALRDMYTMGLWGAEKYETFEWSALWGNPDLGMELPPFVCITLPNGPPACLPPGLLTTCTVDILGRNDLLLPGTARLHYRYDGGDFASLPLEDLGDGHFLARLPVSRCGDTPEYYFSAEGEKCGAVTLPPLAPKNTYTVDTGETFVMLDCNFEQASGWTVQDDPALTDGSWDRGIPVNCSRGDPPVDHDGSGQCFLTDNSNLLGCNSDVDGGYTRLISPTIDLTMGDADVRYALWYTNNYGYTTPDDLFVVSISNDDGVNWAQAAAFGPQAVAGWCVHSFRVGQFVTPTDQVRLRFEASDFGEPSVVEAGIDAVCVSRFDCVYEFISGDLNCDRVVDFSDINAFVLALSNAQRYDEVYPRCPLQNRDINADGKFDMGDINPFVKLLTQP